MIDSKCNVKMRINFESDELKQILCDIIGSTRSKCFTKLWEDIKYYWISVGITEETMQRIVSKDFDKIGEYSFLHGNEKHRARLNKFGIDKYELIIDDMSLEFLDELFQVANFKKLSDFGPNIRTIVVY